MNATATSLFGGLGAIAPSRLSVDAEGDSEQEALALFVEETRRFGRHAIDGAAIDARGAIGGDLLGELGARGYFGLMVPERWGGAGFSMAAAGRIVTELAGMNGSVGTCVGLHTGLGAFGLLRVAPDVVRERYLPSVASGKTILSFAATESGAGSDIASMRTHLQTSAEGGVLSGEKCFVTNGGISRLITVIAKNRGEGAHPNGGHSGHMGYAMVLVDPSWTGVTRQAEERKLGLRGSSTIGIEFGDVRIPRDHILDASNGLRLAHEALTWGRTFMAAGCLGTARAAFKQARDYVDVRQQFGRTLGEFPLVQRQLAECAARLYAMESTLRAVFSLSERGHDIAMPSLVAKVFVSESAWGIVDTALQLMGGMGYMEDAGMARRLRDLRVTRIFEGANDVLRMHLASSLLLWPEAALVSAHPSTLDATIHRTGQSGEADASPLQREAEIVLDQTLRRLAEVRRKVGLRLHQVQPVAERVAELLMNTFVLRAVATRNAAQSGAVGELALDILSSRLVDVLRDLERERVALEKGSRRPRSAWHTREVLKVVGEPL